MSLGVCVCVCVLVSGFSSLALHLVGVLVLRLLLGGVGSGSLSQAGRRSKRGVASWGSGFFTDVGFPWALYT